MGDSLSSGKGYASAAQHLDFMTPPAEYYLPPLDNVWYSVTDSVYGPRTTSLKVGTINSTNVSEFNPCAHSTLRGDAIYRGAHGAQAPFWRKMKTDLTLKYYTEMFQQLSFMGGRPCTQPDNFVFGQKGDMVKIALQSGSDEREWYVDSYLPLNYASDAILATLIPGSIPYEQGLWYCTARLGLKPIDRFTSIHHFFSEWNRPDRLSFQRYSEIEYHDTSSYTPASSISHALHSTGFPYLVEGNVRMAKATITHIRQTRLGFFEVKYDKATSLTWEGWLYPKSFYGKNATTEKGLTSALLIMAPGLTTSLTPDLTKANKYCADGADRAKLLYAHKSMESARTAAVRDVQELDSNWIENLVGLKGTMDVIKPLVMGYKAVKTGNLNMARKALAGAYLSYKYVIAPNISDAQNLNKDGVRLFDLATRYRFSNERRRGKVLMNQIAVCDTMATILYTCTLHLRLKSNYFSQVWSALEKSGLEPTVGQAWDLIPFSFVADWFLPIGDTLRNIDAYNSMMLNRDLMARIEGFKVQWPLGNEVLRSLIDNVYSIGKPVEYSWYDRRIYDTMGTIDPMATQDDIGLSTSQMAQGAALLTTYKK